MIEKKYVSGILLLSIFALSFLLHFRIFSTDIVGPHAWRQTATQITIDCFFEEDNNILHPKIYARGTGDGIRLAEFPLMQWTVAQTYYIIGQSIFATRVVCFAIGLFAILGFYMLLKLLTRNKYVVISGAVLFSSSPLFYYYMINPLPDLLALCAAVWSMYFYLKAAHASKPYLYYLGTAALSIAILCKLPYIIFAGVPLGILINVVREKQNRAHIVTLLLSGLLVTPAVLWYAKVLPQMTWNPAMAGIFSDTKEGHPLLESLTGNLISLLPELYLNYAAVPLFLVGLFILVKQRMKLLRRHLPFTITGILTLLYFFYEINLISTVHDYYMLPFLPLLFLIAARGFQELLESKSKAIRIACIVMVLATPITAYLRIDTRWNTQGPGFPSDWLTYRNELRTAVPDSSLVIMGSDMTQCIMPYYMHKRGWTYVDYELTKENLELYVRQGAEYLYTDCTRTLQDTTLHPLLGEEIKVCGSVHVFSLKHTRQ